MKPSTTWKRPLAEHEREYVEERLRQQRDALAEALRVVRPIIHSIVIKQEADPDITWPTGAMAAEQTVIAALASLEEEGQ